MKKLFIYLFFSLSFILNANIKSDLEESLKLITENKYENAKALLHAVIEKKVENNEDKKFLESAYYYLANIYHKENKIREAKIYYRKLSENLEAKTFSSIKASQNLFSMAMDEGDIEEAINQTEILNKKTNYQQLPFLSNLIYLYETNNKYEKLEKLNKSIILKLSEREKGALFNLLAMSYLENNKYDDAKRYFGILLKSENKENVQLGYIGYSNIELKQENKVASLSYLNKVLNVDKEIPIYILENIYRSYVANSEYESAYDILKAIEKKGNIDGNLIIDLIKYARLLNKTEDVEGCLKKLESKRICSFDIGIKMASENLFDYAERYLIKSKKEGNVKANYALINVYFTNRDIHKLKLLLEDMLKNNEISKEKKDSILKEFEHYQKYRNNRN
ncbi:tetratricopeptide repeat protein [Streptobacillus moniliformis]|uniref:tetratricopeptide repeat protein n=1 Tax=Streptobacillus moniliformis TaxID=34105 RepID=UPI0007E2ED9C|nr:tetratricopeptide repeat protein [Streptobacillus moniliformis]